MDHFGEDELYQKALTYAKEKYKGLFREGVKLPYICHPENVVSILRLSGYDEFNGNEDIFISALLHDVLEETSTEVSEIENLFGKKVAGIVLELTKPEELTKEDWLERFTDFSREAKIVKLADRIDNLRSMETWRIYFSEERLARYREQAKTILRTCGDASTGLYTKLFNMIYYHMIYFSDPKKNIILW